MQVSLINQSTVVTDDQVKALMGCLQQQLDNDFSPVWGVNATLVFDQNPNNWWLVFLDDSDQADALGYHDLTDNNLPIGKVFVKTSGDQWSVTASHELLEMLVDPNVNLCSIKGSSTIYAYEVGDPVENDTYQIGDYSVSNFVYPAWFEENASSGQFDKLGNLTVPFTLSPGGYISYMDISNGNWTQATANKAFEADDRFVRRIKHKKHWRKSHALSSGKNP